MREGRRLRYLFTAPAPTTTGLVALISKMIGKALVVPQLATLAQQQQPESHEPAHLKKTECFTCHTAWAPTCYGCNIRMNYGAYTKPVDVAFDNLA